MRALCLVSLSFVLSGCVSHTFYQEHSGPPTNEPKAFTLATVEFDDHGERWADDQFNGALEAVDQASGGIEQPLRTDGAIVVVFVHGWKHNARPNDGNFKSFEHLLAGLAEEERARAAPRNVLGLYIAWRGDSLAFPDPLKSLSFYDRYDAAARVAGPSMTELLFAVMKLVRRNVNSRCILVGHSMGALILQRAVAQAFVGLIAERAIDVALEQHERVMRGGQTELPRDEARMLPYGYSPPADLIIYVNSAAAAIESKQFVEILSELGFRYYFPSLDSAKQAERRLAPFLSDTSDVASWRPFILSVTSDGDWATGKIFRLAMGIDRVGKRFRSYEPDIAGREWPRYYPSQRELYNHTAGFVPALHSHDVRVENIPRPASVPNVIAPCPDLLTSGSGEVDRLCFQIRGKRFIVARKPILQPSRPGTPFGVGTFNRTPYWIMRVPIGIIKDHNDIFNESFVDFLRGVIGLAAELHEAQSGPEWEFGERPD